MNRITITAEFHDDAKARVRATMKLLGATSVRISEVQEAVKSTNQKPDNIPTSVEAKAVADLFKRKHTTAWSEVEIKAFKDSVKRGVMTLENIQIVSEYYSRERKKEQHYCRRDLLTLVRNFDGELDRARAAKPTGSKALEWLDSNKVVPMTPDADAEEIRRKAREAAEQFKRQHSA